MPKSRSGMRRSSGGEWWSWCERGNARDYQDVSLQARIRQWLRSHPFGMNPQAAQNSHHPLGLAEVAPFYAVNRKHA
jgi:hypothetical protein